MKLLIIGDSHGNIANLKHVLGFGKKIGSKGVIHVGDWNNLNSVEEISSFGIPLYSVLGNADIDPLINKMLTKKCKKFNETFLKIKIEGKSIGIVHKLKVIDYQLLKKLDMVFTGHYHSQKEWIIDGVKIIRPGALENGINFAVYDTNTNKLEFIHE